MWAYDLSVAGIEVTEDNASAITGSSITGTVSYDNSTKTLTLKNALIKEDYRAGIVSSIEGLKIVVDGTCSVITKRNSIYLYKSATIRSDHFSTLNISSSQEAYCGIWIRDGKELTIEDMWLNVTGSRPIYGDGSGSLQLNRCNVTAVALTEGRSCVEGFSSIGTKGVRYDYGGVTFSSGNKRLETSSGAAVESHVLMARIAVGRYIWDVRKNATITNNTEGAGLSAGTITYDSDSRTLTMDGVTMSPETFTGIQYAAPAAGGGDLNVKVVGTNTITMHENTGSPGIHSVGYGMYIEGDGYDQSSLTINNSMGYGIYVDNAPKKTLTLSKLTLNVNSTEASSINGGGTSKLSLNDCTVTAACGIEGFTDFTKNACYHSADIHFSTALKGFTSDDENILHETVKIFAGYPLLICGTRVKTANLGDILGNGQFSYNPDSNTLTLKNAKASSKSSCISNGIEDLIVNAEGSATLTSTEKHGIYSTKSITIRSDSFEDLTVKASASNCCALWLDGPGRMAIEKLWVTATATYPFYGSNTDSPTLVPKYCNIVAKSTANQSCVMYFSKIDTWGVNYDYDGSKYDTANKQLVNSNGDVKATHTIKPYLAVKKYIWDIWSDDIVIDKYNMPCAGVTSGSIHYNPNNGTLIMYKATIDAEDYNGISYYGPTTPKKLIIKVMGDNYINSNYQNAPIFCNGQDMTVIGDDKASSTLTLENSNAAAILIEGERTLAIKDMTLNTTSKTAFYSLNGSKTASLAIDNSDVTLNHSINAFKDFTMTRCNIVEPEGAYFSPTLKAVTTDGTSVYSGKLVIGEVENEPNADVNRDGSVDVADIGCVIDAMAGIASPEIKAAADVNGDGNVDVADIGVIIDKMAAN